MRPQSIVKFERMYLLAWVLAQIVTFLTWNALWSAVQRDISARGTGPGVIAAAIVGAILPLVVLYFVTRRGSLVAKWIILVLIAAGAIGLLVALLRQQMVPNLASVLTVAAVLIRVAAARHLFTPEARLWFKEKVASPAPAGEEPESSAPPQ
jgi:NAD/NADP transhydrogenase beta subunit